MLFRWIYHHYCAMLMAVISLTWDFKGQHPHCEEKQVSNWSTLEYIYVQILNLLIGYNQHGIRHFLLWAMMQGVVMLLQNRYQRQRLYTRIALGKVPNINFFFVFWKLASGLWKEIILGVEICTALILCLLQMEEIVPFSWDIFN